MKEIDEKFTQNESKKESKNENIYEEANDLLVKSKMTKEVKIFCPITFPNVLIFLLREGITTKFTARMITHKSHRILFELDLAKIGKTNNSKLKYLIDFPKVLRRYIIESLKSKRSIKEKEYMPYAVVLAAAFASGSCAGLYAVNKGITDKKEKTKSCFVNTIKEIFILMTLYKDSERTTELQIDNNENIKYIESIVVESKELLEYMSKSINCNNFDHEFKNSNDSNFKSREIRAYKNSLSEQLEFYINQIDGAFVEYKNSLQNESKIGISENNFPYIVDILLVGLHALKKSDNKYSQKRDWLEHITCKVMLTKLFQKAICIYLNVMQKEQLEDYIDIELGYHYIDGDTIGSILDSLKDENDSVITWISSKLEEIMNFKIDISELVESNSAQDRKNLIHMNISKNFLIREKNTPILKSITQFICEKLTEKSKNEKYIYREDKDKFMYIDIKSNNEITKTIKIDGKFDSKDNIKNSLNFLVLIKFHYNVCHVIKISIPKMKKNYQYKKNSSKYQLGMFSGEKESKDNAVNEKQFNHKEFN